MSQVRAPVGLVRGDEEDDREGDLGTKRSLNKDYQRRVIPFVNFPTGPGKLSSLVAVKPATVEGEAEVSPMKLDFLQL